MRLVLDTNVVASALLWDGNPRRLMRAGQSIKLFTSAPLLAELTDILLRPKFDKKIAASLLSVDQVVELYTELAALVRPTAIHRIAPDPDDDVVIGTALSAKAHFLVTGDGPLLSVGAYEGGRIVSVSEALQAVVSEVG
ncbi:MAG: putative toxin-antitoxin system toxin component, PIN family [Bryobacteraceae bacterium]